MFKKLKRRILLVSASSIFIFLIIFVFAINFINYQTVIKDTDLMINMLVVNKGHSPDPKPKPDNNKPGHTLPDAETELIYFTIIIESNNSVILYDKSESLNINYDFIKEYANYVLSKDDTKGFVNGYRYSFANKNPAMKTITFVDVSNTLNNLQSFLVSSIFIAALAFLVIFLILLFLADIIVKPFALNYEKQKTFITDASHELKTPLTIINTNIDILEMEYGENESLTDIHNQVNKLKDLTNDLVLLSRMEENNNKIDFIELPISDIVSDTVDSFKNIASSQSKTINNNIESLLSLNGEDKSIRQLISILLENAIKYSIENSTIDVKLYKHNRSIILSVTNDSLYELDKSKIHNVFDRFYRLDSSRNSNTGGYGIGLSVAKAIVNKHNGKIIAEIKNENKFQINVYFNN